MQVMQVPEARPGSVEDILHRQSSANRYLLLNQEPYHTTFNKNLPHRAIGVVYRPEREKWGNYVPSVMAKRYDALIYLDRTTALHPLHLKAHAGKMPDTYPFNF
jgi:erythromycin esterase-like protein